MNYLFVDLFVWQKKLFIVICRKSQDLNAHEKEIPIPFLVRPKCPEYLKMLFNILFI